ncbi:MAG: hypothetical protein ACE5PM_06230 [Candidatus Hydrothermarchaeales archaeon]
MKTNKRTGISPVIAAIILVAVSVALAIGVAVWMGALTFTFMQTEQLHILSVSYNSSSKLLTINAKNTGTDPITISSMSLEPGFGDVPGGNLTNAGGGDVTSWTYKVTGGMEFQIVVQDLTLTSGNPYEIRILTARGHRFTYSFIA